MDEATVNERVKDVEVKLDKLEKKIDALLALLMQEFSHDFDISEDENILELPESIRGHAAMNFKQDSEFN